MLRGEVISFYAKQVLQHSARRLAGDSQVIDEVRVVTPAAFRDTLRLRQTAGAGVALLLAHARWRLLAPANAGGGASRSRAGPVRGKAGGGSNGHLSSEGPDRNLSSAQRKVDGQGNFSLTTYSSQDGAPVGEYSVTVELRPVVTKDGELELGPNVLPPQYSSPTTTKVQAQVAEGTNTVPIKIVRCSPASFASETSLVIRPNSQKESNHVSFTSKNETPVSRSSSCWS